MACCNSSKKHTQKHTHTHTLFLFLTSWSSSFLRLFLFHLVDPPPPPPPPKKPVTMGTPATTTSTTLSKLSKFASISPSPTTTTSTTRDGRLLVHESWCLCYDGCLWYWFMEYDQTSIRLPGSLNCSVDGSPALFHSPPPPPPPSSLFVLWLPYACYGFGFLHPSLCGFLYIYQPTYTIALCIIDLFLCTQTKKKIENGLHILYIQRAICIYE